MKQIKLINGTATVSEDISDNTIKALNDLSGLVVNQNKYFNCLICKRKIDNSKVSEMKNICLKCFNDIKEEENE